MKKMKKYRNIYMIKYMPKKKKKKKLKLIRIKMKKIIIQIMT